MFDWRIDWQKIEHFVSVLRLAISAQLRAEFYSAMAESAAAGIPQIDTLRILERELPKRHPLRYAVRHILSRIRGDERGGRAGLRTIGTEMKGLFPDIDVTLVAAGDLAGHVEAGWRSAMIYAREQAALRSAILAPLAKPAVYFAALICLLLFFSIQILPAFDQVLPREFWSPKARLIGGLADNVYWVVLFLIVLGILIIASIYWASRQWTGELRELADRHFPIFRQIAQLQSAGFILALASFLGVGTPFGEAVKRIGATASPYLSWQLRKLERYMRQGLRNEEALIRLSMFDRETIGWALALYGRLSSDKLADAYLRISGKLNEQVKTMVGRFFGVVVGNLMLVLIGVLIVLIYMSIFDIIDAAQKQGGMR